jgi:hypothetical protein
LRKRRELRESRVAVENGGESEGEVVERSTEFE